jgi:hypothetical protein
MGSGAYPGGPLGRAVGPVPELTQAPNGTQTWTKNIPQGTHRFSKGGSRKIGGYHKAPQLCLLTEQNRTRMLRSGNFGL